MTRAIHLSGRCTGCGACDRACPENINLHFLFKVIRYSAKSRWNLSAGMEIGQVPIMGSFSEDDPQEFIVHGE